MIVNNVYLFYLPLFLLLLFTFVNLFGMGCVLFVVLFNICGHLRLCDIFEKILILHTVIKFENFCQVYLTRCEILSAKRVQLFH